MMIKPNGACGTLRGGVHKYQFDYSEDTAAGRLVSLISTHARRGVVVDLGCGTAELGPPLLAAGFDYVGYDLDADLVQTLVERGIDARRCDLTRDDPAALVEAALAGRPLAAVTAVDVVEHVPDFPSLLAALSPVVSRHEALLGVSIPNVAHQDLAAKLVAGRWDVTDLGLLDSTHLHLFDERRLRQVMDTAGFGEVARNDAVLLRTEHSLLTQHPYVNPHTSVGEWLRHLRALAGDHATTYQFVRVYRGQAAGAPFDGTAPAAPLAEPSFTVVVLPGDAADVAASTAAVLAQRRPAEQVVVGSVTLDRVETTHVCIVEAGHVVPDGWLEGFAAVLEHHPARVARHPVASAGDVELGPLGLLRTLSLRDEPLCAFAVPVAPSRWLQLAGPDDWWPWLVRTASFVGLVDVPTDHPLPPVARRPVIDLVPALGDHALLLPVGWHHEVGATRGLVEQLELQLAEERRRADAAAATLDRIHRAWWWRLTAPARGLARRLRG